MNQTGYFPTERLRVILRGVVQGVGFRPFVYRLANELNLKGWVLNSTSGVLIEVEGSPKNLEQFLVRLRQDKPSRASIHSLESSFLDPKGYQGFEILPSVQGEKTAVIMPDIATCPECLSEMMDPNSRRYLYPFINCTNCGPRFSIIESLPYDRVNTTMKKFVMCEECRQEYTDPLNRRFHAEPNACPKCGPHIELWSTKGEVLSSHQKAFEEACLAISKGEILAVKGLGGFHLMVNGRSDQAVLRLREKKDREEKPFALMFPSLEMIKECCEVSTPEESLLISPEAPIVLLKRKNGSHYEISRFVAPNNPYFGAMLPYTPLHHLMMKRLCFPVVATSGNLSEEPIVTDERVALNRLSGIADLFLVHNRPVYSHADDSIARVVAGRNLILRRSRGFAPLPIHLNAEISQIIGVGAHLKNSISVSTASEIFTSQHIGDLESLETYVVFEQQLNEFKKLFDLKPKLIAHDLHPGYRSSDFAKASSLETFPVQHHLAHVLACALENEIKAPFLGVAWDGTGYGTDGTVWGGEFFNVSVDRIDRFASFRTFGLAGGEQAIREPRRTAFGLLYGIFGDEVFKLDLEFIQSFSSSEIEILRNMLTKKLNTPQTSSVGRIFDAVSAILGLSNVMKFEGQAAMNLEFLLDEVDTNDTYSYGILTNLGRNDLKYVVDWEPLIKGMLEDRKNHLPKAVISAKFHNSLAGVIVEIAKKSGQKCVILSGGCFQNKYLTERTILILRENGLKPYWHQRIPPNDGGISVGQIAGAAGLVANKEAVSSFNQSEKQFELGRYKCV